MRPRIGITAWLRNATTDSIVETNLYTLASEYVDRILALGGLPIIIPQAESAEEVLDLLDGLLVSGGDDIHPACYGEVHDGTSISVNKKGDDWEIDLIQAAKARSLPTMGICRGMQIMAVASGGKLTQDIGELEGHPALRGMSSASMLALRHNVHLQSNCKLASVYGKTELLVNTLHHQAVLDPGSLQVVGYGSGGIIEALEADQSWPAFAVQWHPEKMDDPLEDRLFSAFITSAIHYAHETRLQPTELLAN